jgi:hypothetical protein
MKDLRLNVFKVHVIPDARDFATEIVPVANWARFLWFPGAGLATSLIAVASDGLSITIQLLRFSSLVR